MAVRFAVPAVTERRTLRFQVQATANGATVRDQVAVTVTPRKAATFDAREATTKARGPRSIPDRTDWTGHRIRR